ICLAADGPIAKKPHNMSYEEAAVIPTGGINALHFLQKGSIQPGEKVLINGAAGSIGTIAVQIAKSMGAEVTVVDSTDKLPMLQSIGADHVIDYTKQDFTKNGQMYDVIFDVVGKSPYGPSLKSLNPKGRYLLGNTKFPQMLRSAWTNRTGDKKVTFAFAEPTTEKLNALTTLIEAGKVKAVIDRRYTLEQMVEAHRYVDSGQKTGHVVVSVGHGGVGAGG
ncbi:MAG: NAD(P)-dependent alcohol dehydrogenase, partial [Algicola sp.]|nr:NAD(P)-dependent alcohol dehydrogenase [Algicola sp.]